MDSTNNDNIFDMSKDYITKKANIKTLIIAIILLIIGVALMIFSFSLKESNTAFSVLVASGSIIVIFGLIFLFAGRKHWVTNTTGSKIEKNYLYFEDKDIFNLTSDFDKRNFAKISDYNITTTSSLRVNALIAADGSFAALRLEKYIPYVFEIVSDTIVTNGDHAQNICDCIKKLKNKK